MPALVFSANLRAYAPLSSSSAGLEIPPVSVLIPARNEENAIGDAVRAVLQSQGIKFEVVVLDDHSEDRTAAIVEQLIATDERVRLVSAPALPAGWCGKQHACWVLAREARNSLLLFIDADVRLAPAALASMAAFVSSSGADLASGIPRQVTSSLLEKLLIPLIHFILLGFLPIRWMRRSRQRLFAAGCGQVFIVRAQAYHRCGGHSVIRDSLHDGIKLPRAFRAAGFKTDLFDATDLATCRMYRTAAEVWFGLAKNACEARGRANHDRTHDGPPARRSGLACPTALARSILLAGTLAEVANPHGVGRDLRGLLSSPGRDRAYRQSLLGAIVHPLGILILLAIQWFALLSSALGRPSSWKGRPYPTPRVQSNGLAARELEPTT